MMALNSGAGIKNTMKEIEEKAYKQIPLNILIHVADFCEKNGIRYSLAYGTLLGAIRHRGFIPWDDDIDIIMPRKDYERFKGLYHSEQYPFSDITVNKEHVTCMGKIYDTKTFFYYKKKIRRSYGLFIDVFVVDNFPSIASERKRWLKTIKGLQHINSAKNTSIADIFHAYTGCRRWRELLFKLAPVPLGFVQHQISALSVQYNHVTTGLVGITVSVDNPKDTYPADLFEHYTEVEFEGRRFSAIKNYDLWLKTCYGNYMQLPPKEKQVSKHDIVAYYK